MLDHGTRLCQWLTRTVGNGILRSDVPHGRDKLNKIQGVK